MVSIHPRVPRRIVLMAALLVLAGSTASARADQAAAPLALLECPDCDDGNACTIDSCDTEFGTCRHEPVICDDGNQCTEDTCSPSTGCTSQFGNPRPCDDGNPCTFHESCVVGVCTSNVFSPEGSPCDDGNPCTESTACDVAHACTGTSRPVGTPCDDANPCTENDACALDTSGEVTCSGASVTCEDIDPCLVGVCYPEYGCYYAPKECDDGNVCTVDSCEPATGRCLHPPGPAVACTGPSRCAQYACDRGNCAYVGGPLSCDDGIACTRDLCAPEQPSGCAHVPDASLCPFSNPFCRDYDCVAEVGCVVAYDNEGRVCGGFNECLDTTCQGGTCQPHAKGPETTCNAGNPCVTGHCESGACFITDVLTGRSCDDRNICTTGDRCNLQGDCAGSPVRCPDDGHECTVDACLSGLGCRSIFDPTEACDDANPCTTESCANPSAACEHVPRTGQSCEDSFGCHQEGTCALDSGGIPFCDAPLPASCDDGNPCTAPRFEPTTCTCIQTAVYQPVTCGVGECERTIDACFNGVQRECVPGEPGPEVCNDLDDDCDGEVDEDTIMTVCTLRPRNLRDAGSPRAFTATCRFRDRCSGDAPLPPSEAILGPAYVSAADLLLDPLDDQVFPDPATLPCPDPERGVAYERGLVEDVSARQVGDDSVTFVFDRPSDGACATLDGGRRDLVVLLSGLSDRAEARVCIAGRYDGRAYEGCGSVVVRQRNGE